MRALTRELAERQLRSVPLFATCSSADLGWIADHSEEHRAAIGDLLVLGGEIASEVSIVLDGYGTAEVGGEAAVMLGPGAVIGGAEALDGALQPMTVIAQTPMVLRVMFAGDFRELVARVPEFALEMIRQLGGRTRTVLDELACARQGSVTPEFGRLSEFGARPSSSVPRPLRT